MLYYFSIILEDMFYLIYIIIFYLLNNMQISHRSNEDFANKYTNKLLFKASNIHLKPNETISPIRKKSMIDSNFASL